ncbi:SIMPL domain-containing protein [Microbacterium sp. H83]|uniref:SIMPL domain-containing protein n=1 Tax=Microbacterium sp. H83 TaxID=1827324 RepID=UPI0007F3F917|nr:SIMPL domain-containing protein [Microbacterium sp. H83]OAN43409.1 neuraminidase [Microbacterium sp. H83]
MSEVTVTVRGEHETRITPERATVRVTVRADGPERADVVERTMSLAEPVRRSITERKGAGSVVDWSSTRLTVRAERPWNSDGIRLDPVYYAAIDLTATFTDVSDLSMWVSDISSWDGVDVGWVDWHLTPETRARAERDVAAQAVTVAVARAQAYATALGLREVTPVEIADVGLIAPAPSQPFTGMIKSRGAMLAASPAGDAAMTFEPDEIVIAATVEARFVAR